MDTTLEVIKFLQIPKNGGKIAPNGQKNAKKPKDHRVKSEFFDFVVIFLLIIVKYTILQNFSTIGAFLRILRGGVFKTPAQATESSNDPRLDRVKGGPPLKNLFSEIQ